ncbi:MAG TPA: SAM-dependent methyltransferase [Candidatus Limnocylindria bacterium]|jgi:SAM-dependent MidA family methyltransferase|nr:SAM-dependent methyltransferase [Candidatus Limnocylindria bacterium]
MTLRDRLVARIRARGPMTFAEYMEAALFDPQDGYYTSRVALGFEGDYLTAPDLGPHFGRALARAFVDLWLQLGKPAAWDLVEAGAGRGIFLRDVLVALERERPDSARGARPTIVEVSPRLREQQSAALAGRDLRWASDPRALAPVHGVIFANEVLDAFPVHVLARTAEGVREAFVEEHAGVLTETLRAPSHPDLSWRVPERLPQGGRWEVSPAAEGWVASLGAALTGGYVLFVDYGGDENELLTRLGAGTLRGFSRHRLMSDPFAEPGAHDLTASVNFTAIRRAAEGAGFVFAGRATQRDALLALGIREATARPETPIEQLRALGRRSAIDTLLDPNGFGAFEFVCFAKDAPTEGLRMFAGARSDATGSRR